ncbi:MAG: UDP-N-acetylglucosamine pyrophosphorylase [Clostridia bacterium]|nr:UDP-N-acetylglucosamine pyrophosphorylase [Clostridia bacterium]
MSEIAVSVKALFDLTHTAAAPLLAEVTYPWEILSRIGAFIEQLGNTLPAADYDRPAPTVWIHRTAKVAPTAYIGERVIIGENTEVRHGAFIRENALVGKNAVVGNSTELKNVILFDKVQVPHYNYVGDSVLGYAAHLGAGAITSNVKSDKTPVVIKMGERSLATDRKKVGAMLGDGVEVGCGSVLNPGTVVGKNSRIYPLSSVRGFVPPDSIYKRQGEVVDCR